ncbi:TonB-dependent receptor [Membranihabitans marinus]
MVIGLAAEAQTINGTVISTESGETLIGATVINKRSQQGTVTDFDGGFTLSDVGSSDTLIVSYIGYLTREVPVNARKVIEVGLEISSETLDEVVVVGYGTVKKSDLTGSVSSINTDDFELTPLNNVSSMLQGSVAGVEIIKGNNQPGGGSIVRIRGGNSMNGSNDPLYVVDGFPSGSIPNPNDIKSIQVLKDASATAIYGTRGANGVIIITTKRGEGAPSINFDAYYGVQSVRNKLDLLGAKDYAILANEKATNIGRSPYYDNLDDLPGETDWQDEMFQNASMENYNISILGGNNKNKYAVFGNYFTQGGIIRNSDFKNGNFRLNLDNEVNDWLNISTSINAYHGIVNRSVISASPSSVIFRALQAPPLAPIYDEDGNYFELKDLPTSDPTWENPISLIDARSNQLVSNTFNGNTNFKFQIIEGLDYNLRIGAIYSNNKTDYYQQRLLSSLNRASISESDAYEYLMENIVSYNRTFVDKHNFNFTGGYTWQEEISSSFGAGTMDFVNDILTTNNLSSGSTVTTPSSSKEKNTLVSWLGRINYSFDSRFLLTFSTRADGSSRLGENNKWGIFPSAAFAWRVSEEGFMKDISDVSGLKLRLSYGVTGNQGIGNYRSLSRLSSVSAIRGANESRAIGYVPVVLQNPDLKWEVTKQFDAGIDLSLFNYRIDIVLDYYKKLTTDLLATVPLSLSSGYTNILKNFGDIKNEGFEFALNTVLLDRKNFEFTLGGNFSLNRNEVLKVATSTGQFFAGTLASPIDSYVNIIKEGYPLSSFFGYLEDGLWDSDQGAESIQPSVLAGDQKYVDVNSDGLISDQDKVVLGSPYPDFIYGFNTNIRYKNLTFSALFQGVQGGSIFNAAKFTIADAFARNGNQLSEVKDHWSSENPDPNAKYPRLSNVNPLLSERFFEDASYFRVKTLSLAYEFSNWKSVSLNRLMIYISGENLITLTQYSGYDPEVSSNSGASLLKGIDIGAYPTTKTFTIGLKASL